MADRKHVVIIGAGVGGCSLAARLAHRGYQVTVLEKHAEPGGRCSLLRSDGHRWDVGPSLYLMPELFASFFASLGLRVEDHVKLVRCDPSYKVHFSPTSASHAASSSTPQVPLELHSSLDALGPELARYEARAGNRDAVASVAAFMKEAGIHYEESIKHVLCRDWNELLPALTSWDLYPMLLRTGALHIWDTAWGRACRFFRSDEVRRAMTFSSMYMGMSPFDAPATYTLLQYAEHARGVWYPVGGFQTVVKAMEEAAKTFGAAFWYEASVKRILRSEDVATVEDESSVAKQLGEIPHRRTFRTRSSSAAADAGVAGVEMEDGQVIYADAVVSNADLVWTYNHLLPTSRYAARLRGKRQTCSSISFYFGLSRQVTELGTHNIFLAEKYRESFDEIFEDGMVPSEPSFYVNVPSRADLSAAPDRKDTLVVLVPCGAIAEESKAKDEYANQEAFRRIKTHVRAQILETMRVRLGVDIAPLITVEHVLDPWEWRDRYNLWSGSILGLSHCISQVLWFRPGNQHAELRNLFFCGASAMPGTGVPVVTAGSAVVADRIDAYFAGRTRGSAVQSPWVWLWSNVLAILTVLAVWAAVR